MNKIKSILNQNFIILGIVFSSSVLLCFLPLTNVIGYEFSVVISLIISFLSGLKIILLQRNISSLYSFPEMLRQEFSLFFLLVVIPFIVSVINTLLFQICPPWHGILFFIIIVPSSLIVGLSLGAVVLYSVNRFHFILYLGIYLIVLLLPLIEIYYRPQIYLYHSIFTFFPGTIYDDLIEIDLKLLFFRFISMLPFIISFVYTLFIRNHSERIIILPLVLFVLLYGSYFSLKPEFGFSTTEKTLQYHLSKSAITDNFIISYPASLTDKQLNNLILHHEFYFKKLQQQTKIKYNRKIHSYVFKNRSQKRKLFGAGNADVAKPWLNQIYTQYESYESSLKHELAHVFASEIGSTIFKVAKNFNPSMIEGYAMAVENNYSGYEIHYLAKIARNSGFDFPIDQLFDGFNFLGGTSSISYIYAGSFIKYLLDEYNIDKVNKLYSNLDFVKQYGQDLNDLSEDYDIFLESLNFAPDSSKAQLFFGRQSLFKRNCPRQTAENLQKAREHLRNFEFEESYNLFLETYNYSASYSALNGSIQSLIELNKFEEASALLNNEIKHFQKSSYYFNILFRQADIYGFMEKYNSADSAYSKLLKICPTELFTNVVQTRIYLLDYSKKIYRSFLDGENPERFYLLSEIINEKNYELLLPTLLDLATTNKISKNTIDKILTRVGISNNLANYYFYDSVSKWYLENNQWQKANFYSQQASLVVNKGSASVSSENLEKNLWIATFADSILTNIRYN